jgi:predicted metal-dependent phosphoesterase TrpH
VIDLHLHTNVSDGAFSPAALVRACSEAGLQVISVTDHDTTEGWTEAQTASSAAGIEFIPGVEVTAVHDDRDVHVLGYFPTLQAPLLESFLDEQRRDRVRRVREMVARLAALGIDLQLDVGELLGDAGTNPRRSVGRPLIADTLIARGYVANRNEAFDRYLGQGRPAFVPRRGATPEDVIGLITAAGGLPSLAHPGLLDQDEIIPALIIAGLPAIEVFHAEHDEETVRRYRRMAERSRLVVTGGSDFHGVEGGHRQSPLGRVLLPREDYLVFRERLLA